MSICRKCGGTLKGDICHRHGSQHRPPPPPPRREESPQHNPWSPETARRVWAMVGKVCPSCNLSCGDLERCPLLRAKWFGDWNGEDATDRPEIKPPPASSRRKAEVQMSLF